jgi:hypothetical protein
MSKRTVLAGPEDFLDRYEAARHIVIRDAAGFHPKTARHQDRSAAICPDFSG